MFGNFDGYKILKSHLKRKNVPHDMEQASRIYSTFIVQLNKEM